MRLTTNTVPEEDSIGDGMTTISSSEILERNELESLENDYKWLLQYQVYASFKQLQTILQEIASKFPMSLNGNDKIPETCKLVLNAPSTTPSDQVKVMVSLCGDAVTVADVNLKLPRHGGAKDLYANTCIREDNPWRLQQIQDAGNHIQMAAGLIQTLPLNEEDLPPAGSTGSPFKSVEEIHYYLDTLMGYLQRSRAALVNPKKRTLEELQKNKNVKGFNPPIPNELALSFYIQSFKLIFAVYHIATEKGVTKFNRYQAECAIPWINDILDLLTSGLQTAQQIKDKLNVFKQYPDFNMALSQI